MREFFILALVIIAIYFLAPIIMGLILFILCIAAIVILLAYFGLLPGFRYARYVGGSPRDTSRRWKRKYPGHGGERGNNTKRGESNWNSGGGWYQTSQEGEEITLPETALRKENDKK